MSGGVGASITTAALDRATAAVNAANALIEEFKGIRADALVAVDGAAREAIAEELEGYGQLREIVSELQNFTDALPSADYVDTVVRDFESRWTGNAAPGVDTLGALVDRIASVEEEVPALVRAAAIEEAALAAAGKAPADVLSAGTISDPLAIGTATIPSIMSRIVAALTDKVPADIREKGALRLLRQGVSSLATRAAVDSYVGLNGELLSDGETLRLHDGSTQGGIRLVPSLLSLLGSATVARNIRELLHAGAYDPRNYGAKSGKPTGNKANDIDRGKKNRAAFQAAANDFRAALVQGEEATFLFPPGYYIFCYAGYVGGHFIGAHNLPLTDGWSSHGIVFDGEGLDLYGGHVHGANCTIHRLEDDPLNLDKSEIVAYRELAASNRYDSAIFVKEWGGMRHTGRVWIEGYRQTYRRAATSGSGWDLSYNVYDFSADFLGGAQGTNSALIVGCNRRKGLIPQYGDGYDKTRPCRNIVVREVLAVNGEHGAQIFMAEGVKIGTFTVRTKPYYYAGPDGNPELQSLYMQRGIYFANCKAQVDVIDIRGGPAHVSVFVAVKAEEDSAFDAHVQIGKIKAVANENQDEDYNVAVGFYDQNTGVGTTRTVHFNCEELHAEGYKRHVLWQDSRDDPRQYVIEDVSPLKYLRIGSLRGTATAFSVNLPLFAGSAGSVILGDGDVYLAKMSANSSTAVPAIGLNIQGVASYQKRIAEAAPITLATLRTQTTAVQRPLPGSIRCVSDWAGGQTTVVHDPRGKVYDPVQVGAPYTALITDVWRPLRAPKRIAMLSIGGMRVVSGNSPCRIAGVDVLSLKGPSFNYEEQNITGATKRCLTLDDIGYALNWNYHTNDNLNASQTYVDSVVPAPERKRLPRSYTKDYGDVAAFSGIADNDIVFNGIMPNDIVDITPSVDIGNILLKATVTSPNRVQVRLINPTNAVINPPSATYYMIARSAA